MDCEFVSRGLKTLWRIAKCEECPVRSVNISYVLFDRNQTIFNAIPAIPTRGKTFMTRTTKPLSILIALAFGAGPALAQQSNANRPAAPAPSKAAPLETGGKPKAEMSPGGADGGALMKKGGGGSMKKKKHK